MWGLDMHLDPELDIFVPAGDLPCELPRGKRHVRNDGQPIFRRTSQRHKDTELLFGHRHRPYREFAM